MVVSTTPRSARRRPLFKLSVFAAVVAFLVLHPLSNDALTYSHRARQLESPRGHHPACAIKELKQSDVGGIVVPSRDGTRYFVNKEDSHGIGQIYVGRNGSAELTCISCTQQPGGPKPERYKMQGYWHPSGRWIIVPVERDEYTRPPILGRSKKYVEAQLRNGLWTNMWAVSPDGSRWHQLTDFKSGVKGTADGYTGPAFTSDGNSAVWSQIVDGNIFVYTFGRWELIAADFDESNGIPRWVNLRTITPDRMHWNEVGNFHPDNVSVLLTGSVERMPRAWISTFSTSGRTS